MPDRKFMRLAIEKAKQGIRGGKTPFAACIIRDSEVVAALTMQSGNALMQQLMPKSTPSAWHARI